MLLDPPPHTEVAPPQANYSQLLAHVWLWRCPLGGSRSTMQTLFHQISVSKARSRTNEKVRKKLCASRFFWGEGKGGSFSFSFLHSTNQLSVSEPPDFFEDFFPLALCNYLSSNPLAVTLCLLTTRVAKHWQVGIGPSSLAIAQLLYIWIFIGTEGAPRRPLTYDNHPNPIHASPMFI